MPWRCRSARKWSWHPGSFQISAEPHGAGAQAPDGALEGIADLGRDQHRLRSRQRYEKRKKLETRVNLALRAQYLEAVVDLATGDEVHRMAGLRDALQTKLLDAFPDAVVSGHSKHRLASYLHISFPGMDAERLVFGLEARGVLVATGSACAANKGTRSHVLMAIGLDEKTADGSLRISIGKRTDQNEIVAAADAIIDVVNKEKARKA